MPDHLMTVKMNLWLWSVVFLFVGATSGYKILFLSPLLGHSLFSQNLIKELLKRHHEVTCITPVTWHDPKPANYTEIVVYPPIYLSQILPQINVFEAQSEYAISNFLRLAEFGKINANHFLSHPDVQKFLLRNDLSFDLVINDEFFMESLSMFAFKFNAPLITISTHGYFDFFDRQFGLMTPWSHVSHTMLDYSDEMSFFERLHNTVISLTDCAIRRFSHFPNQMEIAEKHFGHLGDIPSIDQLVKNVSVILIDMHRFFLPSRPSMPGCVYVGGAEIEQPQPLPADLQTFLDGAKDGAIFFSFGGFINCYEVPSETLSELLNALGQVKQRVIWKFDDEMIPNVPSNVLIRHWLPENDILAHPNVVLFISHGAMLGNFESIYRGVPLLVIPFIDDQFRNAKRAERAGYARQLPFNELNTGPLVSMIWEMTTNKSYLNRAKYMSEVLKDTAVHPMDDAVWWIEHVAKFQGAKHLKSHAVNMSWFTYLLLDVFCMIIFGFLSFAFILYLIIKFVKQTLERKKHKLIKLY